MSLLPLFICPCLNFVCYSIFQSLLIVPIHLEYKVEEKVQSQGRGGAKEGHKDQRTPINSLTHGT